MFTALIEPPAGQTDGPCLIFSVRANKVAMVDGDPWGDPPPAGHFLGLLDGRHCWAVDADEEPPDVDIVHVDLRQLWNGVDEMIWTVAGRGVQLVEWGRTHRYCGRCGRPTEPSPGERAVRCPVCRLQAFPRLSPAVIMLVERDDGRALLGHNVSFVPGTYSCLAGFVEPGETLEDTVRREVREEVGIEIDQVRYRGSQPWPFPHQLMIGFSAHYKSGEVVCDNTEIVEAKWFAPEELPVVPRPMSIARRLIDQWIERSRTGEDTPIPG